MGDIVLSVLTKEDSVAQEDEAETQVRAAGKSKHCLQPRSDGLQAAEAQVTRQGKAREQHNP